MAKPTTDTFALLTAQPVNSTTKPSRDVFAHQANTGMEISVFIVMVDKPGTPPSTLVSAQPVQSGTDTHASIHAQEEEFWTLSVDNVSAPLVTGMVLHVSSAQIIKSGQALNCHVYVLMETGMDLLVSSVQPIKFGTQPPCNAVVQVDKTGTVFSVLSAHPDKTGTLPLEHADAQSDKTGVELLVFHASVEDNGTLSQETVLVQLEAGMDSHASNVLLDKPGTQQAFHAHAHQVLSGTASTAKHAQVQADTGIINLTIVSAEQETGTEHNVLSAQPTATGMEKPVSLALQVDFGTLWIWSANVQMKLNGMVLLVSRHAQTERFFKTVSVFAQQVNSSKIQNASTNQFVKMEPTGMVKHVSEFHAILVLHSAVDATVAKLQSTPAQPVLIGTVQDVFTLQTSAQPV